VNKAAVKGDGMMILAIDWANQVFELNTQEPGVKIWTRPPSLLQTGDPLVVDQIIFKDGGWYRWRWNQRSILSPSDQPDYARFCRREQARDWFLAADMPLPAELADLKPAKSPTAIDELPLTAAEHADILSRRKTVESINEHRAELFPKVNAMLAEALAKRGKVKRRGLLRKAGERKAQAEEQQTVTQQEAAVLKAMLRHHPVKVTVSDLQGELKSDEKSIRGYLTSLHKCGLVSASNGKKGRALTQEGLHLAQILPVEAGQLLLRKPC
jgi:hypothetical protein